MSCFTRHVEVRIHWWMGMWKSCRHFSYENWLTATSSSRVCTRRYSVVFTVLWLNFRYPRVFQSVLKAGPRKTDAKAKVSYELPVGVLDEGSSGGSPPSRNRRLVASSSLSPLFRTFQHDEDQLDRWDERRNTVWHKTITKSPSAVSSILSLEIVFEVAYDTSIAHHIPLLFLFPHLIQCICPSFLSRYLNSDLESRSRLSAPPPHYDTCLEFWSREGFSKSVPSSTRVELCATHAIAGALDISVGFIREIKLHTRAEIRTHDINAI